MSNEKQETIWDIVAEMRRDCPARHMDGTRYRDGDWVYTKGTVEKLADRIEAAMKRGNVQRVHNGRREGCPVREGKQPARRDGHGAKGPGKGWRRFAGDVQEDFQSRGNAQSTK